MRRTVPTEYIPTIDMRKYVNILLSEEVKGNKTEAARISGVDKGRFYYHFRRNKYFREWFAEQCDAFLGVNQAIPSYMLMKKVLDGDVQAIRTYYEIAGKIKQTVKGGDVNIESHMHFTKINLNELKGKSEEELIAIALGRG